MPIIGTRAEIGGTTLSTIRYRAAGLESLRLAQIRMGIAMAANTQRLGARNAPIVKAYHALRRCAKSAGAVKSKTIGLPKPNTTAPIAVTTMSSLRLGILGEPRLNQSSRMNGRTVPSTNIIRGRRELNAGAVRDCIPPEAGSAGTIGSHITYRGPSI
jgi:hypothetical protein